MFPSIYTSIYLSKSDCEYSKSKHHQNMVPAIGQNDIIGLLMFEICSKINITYHV